MTMTFPVYVTVTAPTQELCLEAIKHALEIEALTLRGPLTDADREIPRATEISWNIGRPIPTWVIR